MHSPVMKAMFETEMKEKNSDEIALHEVDADEFAEMLGLISPHKSPDRKSVV